MAKVIYFTAGRLPTGDERSEIDALNAANKQIVVRSASDLCLYGERLEDCDFVAGTPPVAYGGKPTLDGNE